jgi:hypothetical protein
LAALGIARAGRTTKINRGVQSRGSQGCIFYRRSDIRRDVDYGWIENADTGLAVWRMEAARTTHAGGAGKNRKVDQVITLPAGNYKLRYKSDDSHAFDRWNSLPPDINFWGIAVYKK